MSHQLYDHAFTLAFSLCSRDPSGLEIEPAEIRQAIIERLALLSDDELLEAIGAPFDTYDVNQSLDSNSVRQ